MFVLLTLAPVGGCLMEYVLPGDPTTGTGAAATSPASTAPETAGDTNADTGATGDVPTSGDTTDTPSKCEDGRLRCGEVCVDPGTDEANCGECGDLCKSDELCIVGECRDVLVLACDGCPCPDQCPQAEGVLASTASDGDGDSSDQYLCCVVDAPNEGAQVLCVIGDLEDALVCPAEV